MMSEIANFHNCLIGRSIIEHSRKKPRRSLQNVRGGVRLNSYKANPWKVTEIGLRHKCFLWEFPIFSVQLSLEHRLSCLQVFKNLLGSNKQLLRKFHENSEQTSKESTRSNISQKKKLLLFLILLTWC